MKYNLLFSSPNKGNILVQQICIKLYIPGIFINIEETTDGQLNENSTFCICCQSEHNLNLFVVYIVMDFILMNISNLILVYFWLYLIRLTFISNMIWKSCWIQVNTYYIASLYINYYIK